MEREDQLSYLLWEPLLTKEYATLTAPTGNSQGQVVRLVYVESASGRPSKYIVKLRWAPSHGYFPVRSKRIQEIRIHQ